MAFDINRLHANTRKTDICDTDKFGKSKDRKLSKQESALFELSHDAKDMMNKMLSGKWDEAEKLMSASEAGGLDENLETKRMLAADLIDSDKNSDGFLSFGELTGTNAPDSEKYDFSLLSTIFGDTVNDQKFELEDLLLYNQIFDADGDGKVEDNEVSDFRTLLSKSKIGAYSRQEVLSALQRALTNNGEDMQVTDKAIISQLKSGAILDPFDNTGWTQKEGTTPSTSSSAITNSNVKTYVEGLDGVTNLQVITADNGEVVSYEYNGQKIQIRTATGETAFTILSEPKNPTGTTCTKSMTYCSDEYELLSEYECTKTGDVWTTPSTPTRQVKTTTTEDKHDASGANLEFTIKSVKSETITGSDKSGDGTVITLSLDGETLIIPAEGITGLTGDLASKKVTADDLKNATIQKGSATDEYTIKIGSSVYTAKVSGGSITLKGYENTSKTDLDRNIAGLFSGTVTYNYDGDNVKSFTVDGKTYKIQQSAGSVTYYLVKNASDTTTTADTATEFITINNNASRATRTQGTRYAKDGANDLAYSLVDTSSWDSTSNTWGSATKSLVVGSESIPVANMTGTVAGKNVSLSAADLKDATITAAGDYFVISIVKDNDHLAYTINKDGTIVNLTSATENTKNAVESDLRGLSGFDGLTFEYNDDDSLKQFKDSSNNIWKYDAESKTYYNAGTDGTTTLADSVNKVTVDGNNRTQTVKSSASGTTTETACTYKKNGSVWENDTKKVTVQSSTQKSEMTYKANSDKTGWNSCLDSHKVTDYNGGKIAQVVEYSNYDSSNRALHASSTTYQADGSTVKSTYNWDRVYDKPEAGKFTQTTTSAMNNSGEYFNENVVFDTATGKVISGYTEYLDAANGSKTGRYISWTRSYSGSSTSDYTQHNEGSNADGTFTVSDGTVVGYKSTSWQSSTYTDATKSKKTSSWTAQYNALGQATSSHYESYKDDGTTVNSTYDWTRTYNDDGSFTQTAVDAMNSGGTYYDETCTCNAKGQALSGITTVKDAKNGNATEIREWTRAYKADGTYTQANSKVTYKATGTRNYDIIQSGSSFTIQYEGKTLACPSWISNPSKANIESAITSITKSGSSYVFNADTDSTTGVKSTYTYVAQDSTLKQASQKFEKTFGENTLTYETTGMNGNNPTTTLKLGTKTLKLSKDGTNFSVNLANISSLTADGNEVVANMSDGSQIVWNQETGDVKQNTTDQSNRTAHAAELTAVITALTKTGLDIGDFSSLTGKDLTKTTDVTSFALNSQNKLSSFTIGKNTYSVTYDGDNISKVIIRNSDTPSVTTEIQADTNGNLNKKFVTTTKEVGTGSNKHTIKCCVHSGSGQTADTVYNIDGKNYSKDLLGNIDVTKITGLTKQADGTIKSPSNTNLYDCWAIDYQDSTSQSRVTIGCDDNGTYYKHTQKWQNTHQLTTPAAGWLDHKTITDVSGKTTTYIRLSLSGGTEDSDKVFIPTNATAAEVANYTSASYDKTNDRYTFSDGEKEYVYGKVDGKYTLIATAVPSSKISTQSKTMWDSLPEFANYIPTSISSAGSIKSFYKDGINYSITYNGSTVTVSYKDTGLNKTITRTYTMTASGSSNVLTLKDNGLDKITEANCETLNKLLCNSTSIGYVTAATLKSAYNKANDTQKEILKMFATFDANGNATTNSFFAAIAAGDGCMTLAEMTAIIKDVDSDGKITLKDLQLLKDKATSLESIYKKLSNQSANYTTPITSNTLIAAYKTAVTNKDTDTQNLLKTLGTFTAQGSSYTFAANGIFYTLANGINNESQISFTELMSMSDLNDDGTINATDFTSLQSQSKWVDNIIQILNNTAGTNKASSATSVTATTLKNAYNAANTTLNSSSATDAEKKAAQAKLNLLKKLATFKQDGTPSGYTALWTAIGGYNNGTLAYTNIRAKIGQNYFASTDKDSTYLSQLAKVLEGQISHW